MSSREKILAAIRNSKTEALPLPEAFPAAGRSENLTAQFCEVLKSIGANIIMVEGWQEVAGMLQQQLSPGGKTWNGIARLSPCSHEIHAGTEAAAIEDLQTVILEGALGVAENGAIWLPEKNLINRLLPFICQELVLVIEEKNIVADLHRAYENIRIDEDGYGVFVAGPSKTADIEQSLVIGAHGPLRLTVLIICH